MTYVEPYSMWPLVQFALQLLAMLMLSGVIAFPIAAGIAAVWERLR